MKVLLIVLAVLALLVLFRPAYREPRVYRGVFPPETCDHVRGLASKRLGPSTVSLDKNVDENVRKSETAWLGPEDPVVRFVMETCASMTDRPIGNCEKLQVLRYKPGGFYKPHQDAFADEANMRLHTCVVALNDEYEGGATAFPNLGKEYRLKKGDVLVFDTLNDWGRMTPEALHGGLAVTSGEKWICNLWIRTFPYETS